MRAALAVAQGLHRARDRTSQKMDMKGFVIQGVWNDNGSRN